MATLIGERYEILETLGPAARPGSSRHSTASMVAWSR